MQILSKPDSRIEAIDSLRGFALAGILLAHITSQQYLAGNPPQELQKQIMQNPFDMFVGGFDFILLQGKFFAIFSVLFGLSFFLMMDRAEKKSGINFSFRFIWRLVILGMIGLLHSLFFRGDILIIYVMIGVVLPLFYKVSTKTLIIIAGALFLGIGPMIYFLITKGASMFSSISLFDTSYANTYYEIAKYGSLREVLQDNWINGLPIKLDYQFGLFGRGYLTLGYFLVGIVVGRMSIFTKLNEYLPNIKRFMWWSLGVAIVTMIITGILFSTVPQPVNPDNWNIVFAFGAFNLSNTALSIFIISLFLVLYKKYSSGFLSYFTAYGKMGLTNYIFQSIIGIYIFYGWGLGYLFDIQAGYSFLMGIAVIAVQIVLSKWWLTYFNNGPLEYLWRCVTWFTLMPIKQIKITSNHADTAESQ